MFHVCHLTPYFPLTDEFPAGNILIFYQLQSIVTDFLVLELNNYPYFGQGGKGKDDLVVLQFLVNFLLILTLSTFKIISSPPPLFIYFLFPQPKTMTWLKCYCMNKSRPLLSRTFPQGFRKSKKVWTCDFGKWGQKVR